MDQNEIITPYLLLSRTEGEQRRTALPPVRDQRSLSEFFKLFGETTRLTMLLHLCEGELCVGDLAALMDMTPSAISHQLKLLKQGELVRYRREGKVLLYSLADDHVKSMIKIGLEHIEE